MLNFETRRKTKAFRLVFLGLFVHVSIFLGVFDIYFSSPVEHGLRNFKTDLLLADRVVVFVADGLRFESVRNIHSDKHTPFLNKLRREVGTWGVCYTQLPTESRPGHVALFGGMYEDPSAVLSGWKHNPINVDNVFNQSAESWLWGSPDIVPMFNIDNLKKIHSFNYDTSFEDFSGRKSTIELDKWVVENVKSFLKNHTSAEYCRTHCRSLLGRGKLFFLHLLGMDTVGHVFKPNSQEYFDNLEYVDGAIAEIYQLFEAFYKDNRTTYIFTSDHGMTDWGSHGSGSDYEIQTPFIAWGSSIRRQSHPYNIDQADVAPFIATLLGINIPSNSVGVTPCNYLNISEEAEVLILYNNVRQLGERFISKHERLQRTTLYSFFQPFTQLNKRIFNEKIKRIEESMQQRAYNLVKDDIAMLIQQIRKGDRYINRYYKYPLLFTLSLGLLFWMIYLALNIVPWQEHQESQTRVTGRFIRRCLFNYTIIMVALAVALEYNKVQYKYRFYLFFPCLMFAPLLYELNQLVFLIVFAWTMPKLKFFVEAVYCILGVYLLAYSFYNELYIVLPTILLALWVFLVKPAFQKGDIFCWLVTLSLLCSYTVVSKTLKQFSGWLTITGYFVTSYIVFIQIKNAANSMKRNTEQTFYRYVQTVYVIILTLATLSVVIYMTYGVTIGVFQYTICGFSWFSLGISSLLTILTPRKLITRSFGISMALYVMFTMMSIAGESLFLALFISVQLQWLYLEMYQFRKQHRVIMDKCFDEQIPYEGKTKYGDFRRCFFFISFIFLSFFGVGNSADLNTFDPMWARQFVTVFNPFLSAVIIMLKITIPFLITTVFFQAINRCSCTPAINVFSIIMLYCDSLTIHFMYSIKNEGSWLYIGLSISRFVIVLLMTLVLLIFYGISKFLTQNNLFNWLVQYFNRVLKCKDCSSK